MFRRRLWLLFLRCRSAFVLVTLVYSSTLLHSVGSIRSSGPKETFLQWLQRIGICFNTIVRPSLPRRPNQLLEAVGNKHPLKSAVGQSGSVFLAHRKRSICKSRNGGTTRVVYWDELRLTHVRDQCVQPALCVHVIIAARPPTTAAAPII